MPTDGRSPLKQFLDAQGVYDLPAWAPPNGRLHRRFSALGFAISSVRDLRPEIADYDIDGEVSMLVPRTRIDMTLRRPDFTISLRYALWDFTGLLSPQQQVRAGGATELHLKAEAAPEARFLLWLDSAVPAASDVAL